MRLAWSFGGGAPPLARLKVGASVVAHQAVIWLSTGAGSITDPAATTDLTDAMGVTLEGGTYSTTQADAEGLAQTNYDPMAVYAARVNPGATADTAYAEADGYLLTVDTANAGGTLATDSDLGGTDADLNDGELFCLSGANAGTSRINTDWDVPNTRATTTVPFDNAIAVGDIFICSPFAPGTQAVQMTSDFTQADGTIAGGTGGEAVVVDVRVDTEAPWSVTTPYLEVLFIMSNHAYNIGD